MLSNKKILTVSVLVLLLIPIFIMFLLSTDDEKAGDRDLRYQPLKGETGGNHGDDISVHTAYVPIYSHVYFGDGKPYLLTTNLSIRNTDLVGEITIKSVKYYNTKGKLVRSYLEGPLRLGPLASKEVLVDEHDLKGGSGAKFIIEWAAEEGVERPIIEAVMIGASDLRGISFVTTGKEISGSSKRFIERPR